MKGIERYLASGSVRGLGLGLAKRVVDHFGLDTLRVLDEAIQVHGAHGLSQDCKLTDEYIHVRHVRFADGPDAVHLREISRTEARRVPSALAVEISGVNENIERYGKFKQVRLEQRRQQQRTQAAQQQKLQSRAKL